MGANINLNRRSLLAACDLHSEGPESSPDAGFISFVIDGLHEINNDVS